MTELLTAAQMRAIEQAAIESGEVTGLELMERAGQGVVDAILETWPELATAPRRAVVLCGPGNNGGDGFVVARLLKQLEWNVNVILYGEDRNLKGDAAKNALRWKETGQIHSVNSYSDHLASNQVHDVIVDALWGSGLSKPLSNRVQERLFRFFYSDQSKNVAIDIPSGLCMDSGKITGEVKLYSDLTVSFQRMKFGHVLASGPAMCGRVVIKDIGLDFLGDRECDREFLWDSKDYADWHFAQAWMTPSEIELGKEKAHKYSHGHALILSGGSGKGGAARLAARGALRIGAGLVTVGCPEEVLTENAARLDAVMLTPITDIGSLKAELGDRKIKAVCIGPGFGLGERLRGFLKGLLEPPATQDGDSQDWSGLRTTADADRIAVVLDADALTEFSNDPETLFGMLHEGCVLTPHEGEFGRLFPDILKKLEEPTTTFPAYSKVDATREAAKRAGCIVLFKGPDTIIADSDGYCAVNSAHYERSAPWLATAGSGDVLAGFITGLLARGFDPMSAAETAAWLHVECALKFGPGLIGEDIPEQLPAVFRDLGL